MRVEQNHNEKSNYYYKKEINAVADVLCQISEKDIIKMPLIARAEGGDVMPWNDYVFVGYSEKEDFEKYTVARTNKAGVEFLTETLKKQALQKTRRLLL